MIHSIDTYPGRLISVNGKSYLYFGGTSYLGLQTDATFQELFIKNIRKYGTNYGASRKANVQISLFDKVEKHLTNLVGSESCITMSSGYLAGQLLATTLFTEDFEFFYAPNSHSAIHVPSKVPYDTFAALNEAILLHLKEHQSIPVLFMDSINILGNGYPGFEAIQKLPFEKIILVFDDSHGIGIVGSNGCGTYQYARSLNAKELLVCCSLGKGFGIQAGAIFGNQKRIDQLKSTDFYGGASPATPAALATFIEGENLFKEKRLVLQENIELFLSSLKNTERFEFIENYPAFYFSNPKIATSLEKNGILITSFKYPNATSPLMSRIVISAAHTKEDILALAQLLNMIN